MWTKSCCSKANNITCCSWSELATAQPQIVFSQSPWIRLSCMWAGMQLKSISDMTCVVCPVWQDPVGHQIEQQLQKMLDKSRKHSSHIKHILSSLTLMWVAVGSFLKHFIHQIISIYFSTFFILQRKENLNWLKSTRIYHD